MKGRVLKVLAKCGNGDKSGKFFRAEKRELSRIFSLAKTKTRTYINSINSRNMNFMFNYLQERLLVGNLYSNECTNNLYCVNQKNTTYITLFLFSFNFWSLFFSPRTNLSWSSCSLFTSASLGRPWLRKRKSSSPGITLLTSCTPLLALSCTVCSMLWSLLESCTPWSGPDITLNAAFEPSVDAMGGHWS